MLQVGDVLDLTPLGAKFIIRKTSPQSFDMEWELAPRSGGTPVHTHPNAIETYTVLEGALEVSIAGKWRTFTPGEKATVEKGVPHTFRNASGEVTRVYNTHEPALGIAAYFEKLEMLVRSGVAQPGGMTFKALLYLSILMNSHPYEMIPIQPPAPVVKVLAALGRLLGYGSVFAPKEALQA